MLTFSDLFESARINKLNKFDPKDFQITKKKIRVNGKQVEFILIKNKKNNQMYAHKLGKQENKNANIPKRNK